MANNFKGYQSAGITTETTIITGAASTETTVVGLSVANVGAGEASVSIKVNAAYMVKDAPVQVGGSLIAVGGEQKVVLEATDTIKVTSDVAVDVIASTLEIS